MAEASISVEGLPPLEKIIKKVGSLEPVKSGLRTGAIDFIGAIRLDKPQVSRRPQSQFWDDRTRRGFFYYLNRGEIDIPYFRGTSQRSEKMSQSWTHQSRHGGLTQVVGNDTSYGPLVQGVKDQVTYHRETGWKTTDQLAEKHKREVNDAVRRAIDAALEGR